MRIAVYWRALAELDTHFEPLRLLAEERGHTLLALLDQGVLPPNETIRSAEIRTILKKPAALGFSRGWRSALTDFRPDVLLALDEPYCLQTFLLHRWARRNNVPPVFLSCQNIDRPLPFPFGLLERKTLARARGAWFLNEKAKRRSEGRRFRGVSKIIPLGFSPRLACAVREPSGRPFTVGYVGRLAPEKGVSTLFEACSRENVQLLVAGGGPEEANLKELADRLGLAVEWKGSVPSSEIDTVYAEIDLLVLPSKSTPTWEEQFGRVLVEAMAAGIPVLGSDSGEIPNVIGDAGTIFPEGNVDALSGAIANLRDRPELRATNSERGRQRALENFSWERVALLLNELIEEVAGKG